MNRQNSAQHLVQSLIESLHEDAMPIRQKP